MSKVQTKDLRKFLKPFSPEKQEIVWWLRAFVWGLYPTANELIYDNYNAVAFGWSLTDRIRHLFCTIAVGRSSGNIHFGFYFGSTLSDPKKVLLGKGNQYRYILVNGTKDFPKAYMIKLLKEAYSQSVSKVKDPTQLIQGKTITKSISAVKREKSKKKKPPSVKKKKS